MQQQQVKNQNQGKDNAQIRRDYIWIFSLAAITLVAIIVVSAFLLIFRGNGPASTSITIIVAVVLTLIIVILLSMLPMFFQWRSLRSSPPPPSLIVGSLQSSLASVAPSPMPASTPLDDMHASQSTRDVIFYVNVPLPDPEEFYGRALECRKILTRIKNGGSTAIVGSRYSGKTWLLLYLQSIVHEVHENVQIGYVDALDERCRTMDGFVTDALEALHMDSRSFNGNSSLTLLDRSVHDLEKQEQTPVLCIDNFDALIRYKDFDRSFFEGLRAMANTGLVLVLTSTKSIAEVFRYETNASPFFNILLELKLMPFGGKDAENFADEKSQQAGFTEHERNLLLDCARQGPEQQWPPLRLQLTGQMLFEDKKSATILRPADDDPASVAYLSALKERVEMRFRSFVSKE